GVALRPRRRDPRQRHDLRRGGGAAVGPHAVDARHRRLSPASLRGALAGGLHGLGSPAPGLGDRPAGLRRALPRLAPADREVATMATTRAVRLAPRPHLPQKRSPLSSNRARGRRAGPARPSASGVVAGLGALPGSTPGLPVRRLARPSAI